MRNFVLELDSVICGDNVVEKFYSKYASDIEFKNWLNSILPEIQKCENQQQNNPWHKYNVLGHILHSVEEVNKLSVGLGDNKRRLLSYAMLFHDIGKPDKHIQRMKNGQVIDSFFDHNIKSAEIANRVLPMLEFDKNEVLIIAKLIFKHDIFMFIKRFKSDNKYWRVLNRELIAEEIQDLNEVGDGKELLKMLVLIGKADNFAQNEKMTGESLNLLDEFEHMIE
ncbi:MAG: HD domain-containing protein [Clostridiales bacterium]|nr:HD domain-containing protein [Clostridiales bacterium]